MEKKTVEKKTSMILGKKKLPKHMNNKSSSNVLQTSNKALAVFKHKSKQKTDSDADSEQDSVAELPIFSIDNRSIRSRR